MILEEKIIAGSPNDFMEVRYLKIQGTNFEIGRELARIGIERHRVKFNLAKPSYKYQMDYYKEHYPILYNRIMGVNSITNNEERLDHSTLLYSSGLFGCSVVFYPPATTYNRSSIVSRNFDFTTGTVSGGVPDDNEKPALSNPYIIETHPDEGYSSLYLSSFDLLSGVIDGINSEGLVVTMLADDEAPAGFPIEPSYTAQVGLNELQTLRLLLDTCSNVEEAKIALYSSKQYYALYPLHYLIADRRGNSFIWEISHGRNREFIFEANENSPQVLTNFPLYRYQSPLELPSSEERLSMYNRYCYLTESLTSNNRPYSFDFIKELHKSVAFNDTSTLRDSSLPSRTLWHSLYDIEHKKLSVDFYLGEQGEKIKRSGYIDFKL
jgi:predicted choloylglycine hydrolase